MLEETEVVQLEVIVPQKLKDGIQETKTPRQNKRDKFELEIK